MSVRDMNLIEPKLHFWSPLQGLQHPSLDIIINVDGRAFPAHRAVLAEHSGYFKSVLASTSEPSLTLPTVPPDTFALLLSEMYSGVLNLTASNVYQVLLYAQLLQMPSAVLQCKSFLQTLPSPYFGGNLPSTSSNEPSSSKILRPIPSKRPLLPSSPSPFQGKLPPLFDAKSSFSSTPWQLYQRSLIQSSSQYQDWLLQSYRSITPHFGAMAAASFTPYGSTNSHPEEERSEQLSNVASSSKASSLRQPSRQPFVSISNYVKKTSAAAAVGTSSSGNITFRENQEAVNEGPKEANRDIDIENEKAELEPFGSNRFLTSVHLDIAACDGPVKFHRVVNMFTEGQQPKKELKGRLSVEETPKTEVTGGQQSQRKRSGNEIYRCVFCNHIFKSHYCYQKHKRRHINPFIVDYHKDSSASEASEAEAAPSETKKDIKDINVQFFPCKICGAKFPSYYFVHKHKKLWHSSAARSPSPSAGGVQQLEGCSNERRKEEEEKE